jgi:methylase of polypeptide subunit release factors
MAYRSLEKDNSLRLIVMAVGRKQPFAPAQKRDDSHNLELSQQAKRPKWSDLCCGSGVAAL